MKDSLGVVVPPNEVLYADAFEGIQADMVYRYERGGFEAAVILREQPILPPDFKVETTFLELATEFLDAPQAVIDRLSGEGEAEEVAGPIASDVASMDPLVDFGGMQMVRGQAFADGAPLRPGWNIEEAVPVVKRWLVVEDRQVLLESVQYSRLAPVLETLPPQRELLPEQAAVRSKLSLPVVRTESADAEPMLLAVARPRSPGLVLDYSLVVTASQTSFYSGPTFLVTGWVTLSDWTWIQGGAIIKLNAHAGITVTGDLLTPGQYDSRAILTSREDDSVGQPLSTPEGDPPDFQRKTLILLYAQPVSDLVYRNPGKIQRLDIRYARTGIYQHPFSQQIRTGGSVRFAVGAAPAGVTYQWFKNDVAMSGKTLYELAISGVSLANAGTYKVRVRNAGVDAFSQPATLTVLSAGTSVVYTSNQDFAKGILINLNYTTTANQLRMNANPTPLPFVNVPCSGRGTLARIDANSGVVLGEYATAATTESDPSRTAVDRGGNVWVANRGDAAASVTKFGVIVGGIRGNKSGSTLVPDPNGQYLGPPFIYNTCRDREVDGLVKTSRGLANILAWNDDEAMIFSVPWTNKKPRTLAVDKDDNVWVGGGLDYSVPDQPHQKFDGFTGAAISGASFNQQYYGGYGGLIDGTGYLWSAGRGGGLTPGLLRANVNSIPYSFNPLGNSHGNYGIAIDPLTQRVWYGYRPPPPPAPQDPVLGVYNANGSYFTGHAYPSKYARGILVDANNNVWVANSSGDFLALGKEVTHLRTDGTVVGNVDLGFVPPGLVEDMSGCEPTGLAVDTNGKVWVVNRSTDTAMRIDPNAGPEGRGAYRIGAVDLTVDLGDGFQHTGVWQYRAAGPYAYSDMTGFVTLGSTFSSGSWVFVHDEGTVNRVWNKIAWNGSTPYGTGIRVEVRASNTLTQLPGVLFETVQNDQRINPPISNVTGRYLEVRVTLHRQPWVVETPVLYDLTVKTP